MVGHPGMSDHDVLLARIPQYGTDAMLLLNSSGTPYQAQIMHAVAIWEALHVSIVFTNEKIITNKFSLLRAFRTFAQPDIVLS